MRPLPWVTTPDTQVGSRKSTWKYGFGSEGKGLHPGSITGLYIKPYFDIGFRKMCLTNHVKSFKLFGFTKNKWATIRSLTHLGWCLDARHQQGCFHDRRMTSADHIEFSHPPVPVERNKFLYKIGNWINNAKEFHLLLLIIKTVAAHTLIWNTAL